ncbi:hypothetical protein [Vibrio mediterranei]|uniref:hypothetical protein n=1 Tax=Vibrio mediterranei TaxID=689 RepID=UPI00406897C4
MLLNITNPKQYDKMLATVRSSGRSICEVQLDHALSMDVASLPIDKKELLRLQRDASGNSDLIYGVYNEKEGFVSLDYLGQKVERGGTVEAQKKTQHVAESFDLIRVFRFGISKEHQNCVEDDEWGNII